MCLKEFKPEDGYENDAELIVVNSDIPLKKWKDTFDGTISKNFEDILEATKLAFGKKIMYQKKPKQFKVNKYVEMYWRQM